MKAKIAITALALTVCGCTQGNDPLVGYDPASGVPIRRHAFTADEISKSDDVMVKSFDLDPPMGSAAAEYGNCLAAKMGQLAPGASHPVPVGGDCSPFRQRALAERQQALRAKGGLAAEQIEARAESDMKQLENFIGRSATVKIELDGRSPKCQVVSSSGDAAADAAACKAAMDRFSTSSAN